MVKISIDDYQFHIAPLIDACEKKNCHEYWNIIQEQKATKGSKRLEIFTLFNKIVSYRLVPDSPNEPFKPTLILFAEGRRSPIPDDLTPEERDFLQQVLPEIKDTELKARVADTLWVLKHGKAQEHAKTAIESYLIAADTLLKERWLDTWERLARALRIFDNIRLSNKKVPKKQDALKKIHECIESSTTPPHLVMRLIQLLHAIHRPYNDKHVKILETIATACEKENNYNNAQRVWDLAAKLYKTAKNNDKAIECQINAAETYVTLADGLEATTNCSYMNICYFLQQAADAYFSISSKRQRYGEIYDRLRQAQSKIPDEMQAFSTNIDLSDIIKQTVKDISGHDTYTALYKFAFIMRPPHLIQVKKEVEEYEQKSVFSALLDAQHYDRKGHLLFKSSIHDSPESKMHRHIAQFHRNISVISTLRPALQQIKLEHHISIFDWTDLLKDHPFIPPERVNTYAYGLFHGFHGDFLSSAHILIPQIENSIRYLLTNQGKQTSKQILGGTQEQDSFKDVLKSKELEAIFGKDLVFDLQGLLIKKEGGNLRNNIMHGLMDDDQLLFSPEMIYLYWLTLYIIFTPFRKLPTPDPQ